MTTLISPTKTKISKEQQTQLVQLIKHLLSLGKHPTEIKRAVVREYDLASRSVERYITRARREMTKCFEVPIEQLRAEAIFFYISIINDTKSQQRERLRARERIDKLLGLDKYVHSQYNISKITLTREKLKSMTDEELEETHQRLLKECGLDD